MKFKFSRLESSQQRISIQSARRQRLKFDTRLAESWNELRVIGSEDAYKKLTDVNHDPNETLRDLESHDWDLYITQYNEKYKKQRRDKERENDVDSISTIAETMSKLIKSRRQRLMLYHKLFLTMCLLLWAAYSYLVHVWYVYFIVYPVGFLSFKDADVFTQMYTPERQLLVFILYHHTWLIGSFGVASVTCFRDNPAVMRQFILRVPYALLIPIGFIFGGVEFTGALNAQDLKVAMEESLSNYYDKSDKSNKTNDTQWAWQQIQLMLHCCGISGPSDWHTVDDNPNDNVSPFPESCCPKKNYRDKMVGESPPKDDCFDKVNPMLNTDEYEWAYPHGCGDKALEFFVKLGATAVGAMFIIFLILCLCLVFGKQYYTLKMKNMDLSFKYYFRDWIADIFYWRTITKIKRCICKTCCGSFKICERCIVDGEEDAAAQRRKRKMLRRSQSGSVDGRSRDGGRDGGWDGGRDGGRDGGWDGGMDVRREGSQARARLSTKRVLSAPFLADPNLPDYSRRKEDEEGVKFRLTSDTKPGNFSTTSILTIVHPRDEVADETEDEMKELFGRE